MLGFFKRKKEEKEAEIPKFNVIDYMVEQLRVDGFANKYGIDHWNVSGFCYDPSSCRFTFNEYIKITVELPHNLTDANDIYLKYGNADAAGFRVVTGELDRLLEKVMLIAQRDTEQTISKLSYFTKISDEICIESDGSVSSEEMYLTGTVGMFSKYISDLEDENLPYLNYYEKYVAERFAQEIPSIENNISFENLTTSLGAKSYATFIKAYEKELPLIDHPRTATLISNIAGNSKIARAIENR